MVANTSVDAMNRELAAASTDLVGNDDLLRGVLAGCGDCIKVLDLEGRLQFMSEGGKRVMEVEDFSALKGCPWPDFWAGEGNAQARAAIAEAKEGRTAHFRNAANTAKGTPRHWDVHVSPIFGADGKPAQILSISRDITDEWEAIERQTYFANELTHRVKNTLATVISIGNQTFRGPELKDARESFGNRIHALSMAYETLNASNWSDSSIKSVIEKALLPYQTDAGSISIGGPEYDLSPDQALALALAVNELATNAMKYGSLSSLSGKLSIGWSLSDGALALEWKESGGPSVTAPTRSGFGNRVIKIALAQAFGGAVELEYAASGLRCVLKAPAK